MRASEIAENLLLSHTCDTCVNRRQLDLPDRVLMGRWFCHRHHKPPVVWTCPLWNKRKG